MPDTQTAASAEQSAEQHLHAGIQAARQGRRRQARQLFLKVTELDPLQQEAWLWLAGVADSPDEALVYLQTVLAINPNNRRAQEGLRWVQQQRAPDGDVNSPSHADTAALRVSSEGRALLSPAEPALCTVTTGPAVEPERDSEPSSHATHDALPRLVLSVEQAEAIDACLDHIASRSRARCIILADVTGQLIAERGQTSSMNTQVLSALAAGELVATHELAKLVGERARFRLLLNEGERQNVYLSDVGEQLILIIVSDNDIPIGLVRLVLKQAVEELAPILVEPAASAQTGGVEQALGEGFAQLVQSELDASLER